MSSIHLNSQSNALDQLRDINMLAQSSKGTAEGRIGMFGDRVVKFNTHWSERWFGAAKSQDMISASNNLRERLCGLIDQTLLGADMEKERTALKAKIGDTSSKKLLDRSIVADVIGQVETIVNAGKGEGARVSLSHTSEELKAYSSKGKDTSFKAVAPVPLLDEEKLKGMKLDAKFKQVATWMDACFKSDAVDEMARKHDNKIQRTSDFVIEDPDSFEYAMDEADLEEAIRDNDIPATRPKDNHKMGTMDYVAELHKRYPDAKIGVDIFGDNRSWGGGWKRCVGTDQPPWGSQEETSLFSADPASLKALHDNYTEEGVEVHDYNLPRTKYCGEGKDGSKGLNAMEGYLTQVKIIRDSSMGRLEEPIDATYGFTAMMSLSDKPLNFDAPGNARAACGCANKPAFQADNKTPSAEYESALAFTEALHARKQANQNLLNEKSNVFTENSKLNNTLFVEAMYLLSTCPTNDVFNVFCRPEDREKNLDALISLVQNGECKVAGPNGTEITVRKEDLLKKADENYEKFLTKNFCGWISSRRQAGIEIELGGKVGCGQFGHLTKKVIPLLARQYARHCKDPNTGKVMKYCYAAWGKEDDRQFFIAELRKAVKEIAQEKAARAAKKAE